MTLESLRALQTRIREATGPDRELDIAIWDALDPTETIGPPGPRIESSIAPPYTTDPDGLGACVALHNEMFPSGHWARTPDGTFRAFRAGYAHEANPLANDCLTFLDAIFSAKIAELEAEQEKEKADV